MKNYLWLIITIGFALRIFLSATTFHPDIQAFNLAGKIWASGNILNLYDYLPDLPDNDPIKNLAVLNYPPAIYFYHGVFNFIFNNIFGLTQINQFLLDNPLNYGNIQFSIHLFLLKFPYLIFDLLTGLVIYKLFNSVKTSIIALALWTFNPISLYATYMMGQFDIIPTFFIILSVYMVTKNKLDYAALSLGFGIAFKLSPIFLIIPLFILGRNFFDRLKLIILSLVPYLLSVIPYLTSHDFRTNALFANQSSKSFYASIPVSGGESILLFPVFLLFYYLVIWINKKAILERAPGVEIWKLYLIPLLLFFIFTHYHAQWLIWITPLMIMDLTVNKWKNFIPNLLIFLSWFASLFFFDPSLTIGMFAPLFPALHNSPSIWEIMHLNLDYNLCRSMIQTIFTGASIYLIYLYFPKKIDE